MQNSTQTYKMSYLKRNGKAELQKFTRAVLFVCLFSGLPLLDALVKVRKKKKKDFFFCQ